MFNWTDTSRPVCTAFNAAVLHIAGRFNPLGWDVSDNAPSTLAEQKAYVAAHGRLCVWGGASDNTIFADPEVNLAFRAWHDAAHLALGADFSIRGERRAAYAQIGHVATLYGVGGTMHKVALNLVQAEVIGQAMYRERHGGFPVDQRAFAARFVAYEGKAPVYNAFFGVDL